MSGTLTFDDASPTEQCISVMTIEDTTAESLECFRVVLNNDPNVLPADVTVDPSDAAVCIADDDGGKISSENGRRADTTRRSSCAKKHSIVKS